MSTVYEVTNEAWERLLKDLGVDNPVAEAPAPPKDAKGTGVKS